MNVDRDLTQLASNVLSDDPRVALVACRRLREELAWLDKRAVRQARRADWPWARIAKLLGTTRQAVHRRFRVDDPVGLRPMRDPAFGVESERRYFQHERDARLAAELRSWEQSGDEIVPW